MLSALGAGGRPMALLMLNIGQQHSDPHPLPIRGSNYRDKHRQGSGIGRKNLVLLHSYCSPKKWESRTKDLAHEECKFLLK
jgi:hypothetical protein